jgi:hypothetical protein
MADECWTLVRSFVIRPDAEESHCSLLSRPISSSRLGSGMEGLWVQAMATRFPKAEVLGIDLVPVDVEFVAFLCFAVQRREADPK